MLRKMLRFIRGGALTDLFTEQTFGPPCILQTLDHAALVEVESFTAVVSLWSGLHVSRISDENQHSKTISAPCSDDRHATMTIIN